MFRVLVLGMRACGKYNSLRVPNNHKVPRNLYYICFVPTSKNLTHGPLRDCQVYGKRQDKASGKDCARRLFEDLYVFLELPNTV